MQAASWPFETSLAVFLVIAFASQAIAVATKSRLSLQFGLGAICIAGFAIGLFPPDFVEKSKMKDVGFIAFNVQVVHSGTLVDFGAIRREWRSVTVAVIAIAVMTAGMVFGLPPLIGHNLAVIAPGPVVGGGAACAIASIVLAGSNPAVSVFPWLVFMTQGLLGVPLCAWALKRSSAANTCASSNAVANADSELAPARPGQASDSPRVEAPLSSKTHTKICDRIPDRYKSTSYYLGALMIVSVLNRWASVTIFSHLGLGINVTALLFGMVLGRFGFLDRNPLAKSDSFGFLMLGLMALMANTIAHTPIGMIMTLAMPAVAVAATGVLILASAGAVAGGLTGIGACNGAAVAVHCTVGFPSSLSRFPAFAASSMLVINMLSIFMASIAGLFLAR
jgi:hypothetical protein